MISVWWEWWVTELLERYRVAMRLAALADRCNCMLNCCGLINDAVVMIVVSYVGCGDIWYSLTHIYT